MGVTTTCWSKYLHIIQAFQVVNYSKTNTRVVLKNVSLEGHKHIIDLCNLQRVPNDLWDHAKFYEKKKISA